jgi:hypothetical protein
MARKYCSVPRGRQTETYNTVTPFHVQEYPADNLLFKEE